MHIILKTGLDAAKKNVVPGIVLQGIALTLVLLYFFCTPVREILLRIPEVKQRIGFLFPLLAAAITGGVIPFIFMVSRRQIAAGERTAQLLFLLVFFSINGLIVSALYDLQAVIFGDQMNTATVIKKVCVDQFIYNPVWGVPYTALAFHWRQCGFSFRVAAKRLSVSFFVKEWSAILLATWVVWIPTVAIVYCLPLALQFPLVSIVGCFWSLLLSALSLKDEK